MEFKAIPVKQISHVLKFVNQQSTLGYGKITNKALATVYKIQHLLLTQLFNDSLAYSHFSEPWKYSTCLVIPNPIRDSMTLKSWHPRKLLSVSSKVLEYQIYRQVKRATIETGVVAPTQFGAILGKSDMDVLTILLYNTTEVLGYTIQT